MTVALNFGIACFANFAIGNRNGKTRKESKGKRESKKPRSELFLSRTHVDELHEDASDGPDVDLRSVLRVSDQKLGSSVPAGRDVVGEVLAGC